MADYKVQIGTLLDTSGINTTIKNYKGNINVGAILDTSNITSTINSYKAKPINVDSILNTDGITKKIRGYVPPKKIHLESDLSTVGIDNKINDYTPPKPIRVDVELTKSSINQQIRDAKPTECITVGAVLDDNAITTAIRDYKASSPIRIKAIVDPDFSEAGSKISNYQMRNMLRVNVRLNKTAIDSQIKNYQTSAKIEVGARLRENAIESAIRKYAGNELVPISIDFKVGDTKEVSNKINEYKNTPVPVYVKLQPATKGFDSLITKKPINISATLEPENINKTIDDFVPRSKVNVDVKLTPKNINAEVKRVETLITDPLNVNIKLNESKINADIALFTPTATLGVKPDLILEDVDDQIRAYVPQAKINVNVDLNKNNIANENNGQNIAPTIDVNVKLNREQINDRIRKFKTSTKINVGVHLDFASHNGGQKGVPQQIKDYKTASKIRVGVELDRNSINQEIQNIQNTQTNAPIRLGVELDPNGIQNVQNQINALRQQIQGLGNVNINLGGNGNGGGGHGGRRQVDETAQAYRELMGVLNELNSKRLQLNNLYASSDASSNKIQRLRLQIEQLDNEYNNLLRSFNIQGIQFTAEQWNQLETAMARVGRQIDVVQAGMSDKSAIQSQTQAYRELITVSKEISSLEINIARLKTQGGNTNQIAELENQLRTLQSAYQQIVTTMQTPLTADQWSDIYTQIAKTSEEIEILKAKHTDAQAELSKKVKLNIDNGTLQGQINSVTQNFNKLGIVNGQVTDGITKLQKLLNNMDASDDVESVNKDYQEFLQTLTTVKNAVADLQRDQRSANGTEMFGLNKESALLKLRGLFEDGSQAARKFGERARQLENELNACGEADIGKVTKKINNFGQEVKNSHLQTKKFSTTLKEQFSRYRNYFSAATVVMYAVRGIRSMFQQVKAIDSAMTELKKVTNETDASYNEFLRNAGLRAKELGTTIDGLVNSAADFARLGYGFKDSQKLAEVANIYAVVGDEIEGVEGATQSLVSTLAAFKKEMGDMNDADFAMSIVDKMNEVSNNFAISSGGIGEALQRSASSMAAANNTLDETIAMITAANEVAQNPEKVGKWLCRLKKWLYRLNS